MKNNLTAATYPGRNKDDLIVIAGAGGLHRRVIDSLFSRPGLYQYSCY